MHNVVEQFNLIKKEIHQKNKETEIIVVTKTFSLEKVKPLVGIGHKHFGENKVQEAIEKWSLLKENTPNIKLHMIGKLQSNKVKNVVPLFDYIHSLDNYKLAEKIAKEQEKFKKKIKLFIQVNIGEEEQKSGVNQKDLPEFFSNCIRNLNLDIIGLMCLPPMDKDPKIFFKKMQNLKKDLGLKELSMGMSGDYLEAMNYGSTFVRIGSKILGNRSQ
jgi:pyridoxal phosphate enzyme, YggS family